MIQKVMPKMIMHKPVNRAMLKSVTGIGLLSLAGSSMSGGHITPSVTKDMIIPGGLDFKEKAFYLLTGELPKSVKERLVELNSENIPVEGDQVVNLTMRDSHIEFINEGPHGITETASLEPLNYEGGGSLVDLDSGSNALLEDVDGDSDISVFEIWKHLSGMQ